MSARSASLASDSRSPSLDFFVARQPIFGRDMSVYGYELLFRSCQENSFDGTEANLASSQVIANGLFSTDAGRLLSGKKAFINFGGDLLATGVPLLIPPHLAVIEILETTEVTSEVHAACLDLRAKGYQIAIDDFCEQPNLEPLLDLADILKVDFRVILGNDRRRIVERYQRPGRKLLAEKVENYEEFRSASDFGYAYFQGFFFAQPTLITGREIAGFKLNYVRILAEMNKPELDYVELGSLIRQELSLATKLLRYINSAAFSWRGHVTSLNQALALLGENVIRHWIPVAVLLDLTAETADELVTHALIRARFCELMFPWTNLSSREEPTLFLIGMLSLLDAILERPLDELLAELALSPDLRQVILGTAAQHDRRAQVLALVKAYEAADWIALSNLARGIAVPSNMIKQRYLEAVDWATDVFRSAATP